MLLAAGFQGPTGVQYFERLQDRTKVKHSRICCCIDTVMHHPPIALCYRLDLMLTVSIEGHVGYAVSCTQLLCVKHPLLPVVCDQQGATLEGAGQLDNQRTKHAGDLHAAV